MSGQLVGEVLDAMKPGGPLECLLPADRLGLIAIAEKCHATTRQGSVPIGHIQATIGKSKRTADRVLRRLKDAELIRVVKRGYKAPGPDSKPQAPIYELSKLPPPVAKAKGEAFAISEQAFAISEQAFATPPPATCGDSAINGSTNGSTNGERDARASDEPNPTPAVPDPGNALSPIDHPNEEQNIIDAEIVDEPPDPEPPEFCDAHMPHGTSRPCPDCKIARLNHERWTQRQTSRLLAAMRSEHNAGVAATSIPDCPLCDDGGWRLDHGGRDGDTPMKCDHRESDDGPAQDNEQQPDAATQSEGEDNNTPEPEPNDLDLDVVDLTVDSGYCHDCEWRPRQIGKRYCAYCEKQRLECNSCTKPHAPGSLHCKGCEQRFAAQAEEDETR